MLTLRAAGLQPGDIVRFAEPHDDHEAAERFTVVELRGPRVLVRAICSMPIPPTFSYPLTDVRPA